MRFYLDEDLPAAIAGLLRRRGPDAVSAHELGHLHWTDEAQLAYAARDRRVLVTRNANHFIDLCREAIRLRRPHAGIVICSHRFQGREIAAIATALVELAERYPKGLGEYDLVYIQPPSVSPGSASR